MDDLMQTSTCPLLKKENKSRVGGHSRGRSLLDVLQILLVLVEGSLEVLHDHLLELVSRHGLRDPLPHDSYACLLSLRGVVVEGLRSCEVSLHILQDFSDRRYGRDLDCLMYRPSVGCRCVEAQEGRFALHLH